MNFELLLPYIIYTLACVAAGIVNTLAGGGSFLTFPALLMTGLDARAANITSTIALYPMQISTGLAGRKDAAGTSHVSLRILFLISIIGGSVGAGLLLMTPSAFFNKLVPWFILFATAMFAWSSFFKKPAKADSKHALGATGTMVAQLLIGIYGGYFGAGIGILMLAALSMAGMAIKPANATKIILAAAMNTMATIIFMLSPDVAWLQVGIGIAASMAGGQIGLKLLGVINEKALRGFVVAWGALLSLWFFFK